MDPHHTLYFDPLTECAMMCVTAELMSPRMLAPMKWAWLQREDSSALSLKPVKQRTRPSMLHEYIGRLLRERACVMERVTHYTYARMFMCTTCTLVYRLNWYVQCHTFCGEGTTTNKALGTLNSSYSSYSTINHRLYTVVKSKYTTVLRALHIWIVRIPPPEKILYASLNTTSCSRLLNTRTLSTCTCVYSMLKCVAHSVQINASNIGFIYLFSFGTR